MRPIKLESQDDAIDIGYRINGLSRALVFFLSDLSGFNEGDKDARFAAQMIAEAIGDYSSAMMDACESSKPDLVFSKSREARREKESAQ
jgi:hypothetical protein